MPEPSDDAGQGLPVESSVDVQRVTRRLREQVLKSLRRATLDFRVKPGQRLAEREFIEQVGVSPTVTREALRPLVVDSLVKATPPRETRVAGRSPAAAADLSEVRDVFEAPTVRRNIARALGGQVTEIEPVVGPFRHALNHGRRSGRYSRNRSLLRVLLDGAGKPEIRTIPSRLQARVRMLRAYSPSTPGRPQVALEEPEAMIEAIKQRVAAAAANACVEHRQKAARAGFDGATDASLPDDPRSPPATRDAASR